MKFKEGRFSINSSFSTLLIASASVFATVSDIEQPIYITSDTQYLDIRTNIATFIGNVTVTQSTIKIQADKVVITRSYKKYGKEIIDSYGDPVIFYQIKNNCILIKGCASQIHYEPGKDYVMLTGNAHLYQQCSNISGDKITYLVKDKKVEVFSNKGKRVTATLMPKHLQNQDKTKIQYKKNH